MAGPRGVHLRTSSQHPLSGASWGGDRGGSGGSAGGVEDGAGIRTSKRTYHPGVLPPSLRPHLVGAGVHTAPEATDPEGGDGDFGEEGDGPGEWQEGDEGGCGSSAAVGPDGGAAAGAAAGGGRGGGGASGGAHRGQQRTAQPAKDQREAARDVAAGVRALRDQLCREYPHGVPRQVLLRLRAQGGEAAALVDLLRLDGASVDT